MQLGEDMAVRKIVRIDEELCNGCAACVTPCAEGAIELVNGKARMVNDMLCDGAGFCLGVCPTGALSIEEREAAPFDDHVAEQRQRERGTTYISQRCFRCDAGEESAVLLPCRQGGRSLWVCTRCLPALIHG